MKRKVDQEMLDGFIEEAKSYVPTILGKVEVVRIDPTRLEAMEEAYRQMHTIKGAAAMLGLTGLSHAAYCIEELFEDIASDQMAMDDETATSLCQMVNMVEEYLDSIGNDSSEERPLLVNVTRVYRRLRGLPEEVDEEALDELVSNFETSDSIEAESNMTNANLEAFDLAGMEEVPQELMEIFVLEAEDHIHDISTQLASIDKMPGEKEFLSDLRRSVHTLKGAAGAVGLRAVAQLTHRMEDLLDQLYDDLIAIDGDVMDLLFSSADALDDLSLGEVDIVAMQSTLQDLYPRYSNLLEGTTYSEEQATPHEPLVGERVIDLSELIPRRSEDLDLALTRKPTISSSRMPSEVVRVPLERLDELVRLVSELVIERSVFEQRMADFLREIEELQLSSDRLRRVSSKLESQYEVSALGGRLLSYGAGSVEVPSLRPLTSETYGFDDLEFDRYTEFHLLSRELVETTSDIRTVGNELGTLVGDFDSIKNRQGRLTGEIQDRLMRTRMVPLASLATRLYRSVRVLARERGKLADLEIEGEEIELDKTVLEEMADPLLHLMRNAVDHGIEPAELRQVKGKPARGFIRLRAFHEGNQVVLSVSDDGAGLESQIIRSTAVTRGYIPESDAALLSEEELQALIFLPGFSTAGEISEVSGRGVGLDIVKTKVHKLKGSVTLESVPDQGVTFTIRLPMTLAVTRAMLVKAHGESFAIPLNAVTQIHRLERDEIELVGQEPVIRIDDQVYPVIRLGELLKLKQPSDVDVQRLPVLILNTGREQIALVVDQLVAGREIVIKTLGNHLRRVHGISGATLMGDGSVVLILNPAELGSKASTNGGRSYTPIQKLGASDRKVFVVMIVDDSLSVRRVVSNLIKGAGWRPMVAKDGLEALEEVQQSAELPDVILVDIEMPRMDGYELISTLKAHALYRNIPLVVLTSRAGEKHRKRALELGASEYIVKPYQDEVLISVITRLAEESKRTVSV